MADGLAYRRRTWKKGLRAESYAAFWLRLKGYRIAARRLRTPFGEIDLIARRGNVVLIVEIKARNSLQEAMAALTPGQQRRIETAAQMWLMRQPDYARLCLRFDLIAVLPWRLPVHVAQCFGS